VAKFDQIFHHSAGNYIDTGAIIGIVFGVLGGLFLIAAGIAFYMRSKNDKGIERSETCRFLDCIQI